jgi:GTP cyclohydrolase I
MCKHHILPFIGHASIAYIPDGKILGLSKFARVVDMFSSRLQLQEDLVEQIAEAIIKVARPKGVLVYCKARHFCSVVRGVKKDA